MPAGRGATFWPGTVATASNTEIRMRAPLNIFICQVSTKGGFGASLTNAQYLGSKKGGSDLFRNLLFWNRLFRDSLVLDEFLELFHAGKLAQVFQTEVNQKFSGRFIEDRPPEHILAAGGRDELLIEQSLDDTRRMNSANLLD